jgi:hypothetical protein
MSEPATHALKCPSCGSFFRAGDLDAARGVLTCRFCRVLTLFSTPSSAPSGPPPRGEVALPARFTIEERADGGLAIHRRWFRPQFLFLLGFCVIWFGALSVFYAGILASGAPGFAALFPLLHVGIGLWIAYFTLAGLFNTSTITVHDETLSVRHGPLPWRGVPAVPAARITQLYCKQRIHHGKNGTTTTYEVWIARDEGGALKLVSGLDDPDQALFVEQRVEKALGLSNLPMPGELPR